MCLQIGNVTTKNRVFSAFCYTSHISDTKRITPTILESNRWDNRGATQLADRGPWDGGGVSGLRTLMAWSADWKNKSPG